MASRSTQITAGTGIVGANILAIVGIAMALSGNVSTDSSQNVAPSQLYDSGAYVTYREAEQGKTRTGTSFTTGTSSGCLITNPYDGTTLPWNGSGVVTRFQLEVKTNPTATKWEVGPTDSSTTTGSLYAARGVVAASGVTVNVIYSGANLTARQFIVNKSKYYGAFAQNPVTSATRYKCKIWLNQMEAK